MHIFKENFNSLCLIIYALHLILVSSSLDNNGSFARLEQFGFLRRFSSFPNILNVVPLLHISLEILWKTDNTSTEILQKVWIYRTLSFGSCSNSYMHHFNTLKWIWNLKCFARTWVCEMHLSHSSTTVMLQNYLWKHELVRLQRGQSLQSFCRPLTLDKDARMYECFET